MSAQAPVAESPASPKSPRRVVSRFRPRPTPGSVAIAVTAMASVSLPWIVDAYTISLATNALVLALLAASVQVMSTAGLPSLGQTAYLGVGAYTAAWLALNGVTSAPVQLLAAGAAGGMAALASAPLVLRTRGVDHLMVTLAVGQLVVTAVGKTHALGGDEGLVTPAVTLPGGARLTLDGYLYLYALAVAVPVFVAVAVALRGRLGLMLRGMADNEDRVAALGHAPGHWLLAGHLLAAVVAASSGALLVAAHRFVSPTDLGFDAAACALLACAIGAGSVPGVIASAVAVVVTRDLIGGATTSGHGTALLGCLFLIAVYARAPLSALVVRARRSLGGGR